MGHVTGQGQMKTSCEEESESMDMWWSERRRVKQAELVVTECEAVVKRRDKEKSRGSEPG